MDTAIVTTRLVGQDAMSNFTMASASALTKLGKVTVFAFAYERPPVDGVDIRLLGGRNAHSIGTNLAALAGTPGLARELSKYDLLLIVNPDVGVMPAYHLAKLYNKKLKVAWTFHGLTPVQYVSGLRDRMLMRVRKAAYGISIRRADVVQVFSEYIRKEISGWGISPGKIVVTPFGVDLERMASGNGGGIKEKYGLGNVFLLLYVGRLVNFKHVDELIRAVSMVDKAGLVIVGSGPELEDLEKLATDLRVEGRVRFAGRVPDAELPGFYAACDAWATASRHEGFCVPVAEAMAAGKPVIIPDAGAIPDTAGDAGLVYRSGDVGSLADRIRSLSTNERLYRSLADRARGRASRFDMDHAMGEYVELISRQVRP